MHAEAYIDVTREAQDDRLDLPEADDHCVSVPEKAEPEGQPVPGRIIGTRGSDKRRKPIRELGQASARSALGLEGRARYPLLLKTFDLGLLPSGRQKPDGRPISQGLDNVG
jgi:hypothetical protein